MAKMVIHGGKRLSGSVTIGGAKNSTVAIIPAAILSDTPVVLDSVPQIKDVYNLMDMLADMNVKSSFQDHVLTIDPTNIKLVPLPHGKVTSLRASYYFMGSLLGRFGKAVVGFPGGDDIGPRPIDQHIKGFKALGAQVKQHDNSIVIEAPNGLHGARIFLDMVSVGATINIILAAVRAKGTTIIENAAKEPEIIDLATFLNNMGAKIRGVGTQTIRIVGVPHLKSTNSHIIIPDRIEAGTYLSLAAAVGDGILVKNIIAEHLDAFLAKLQEMGVNLDIREDSIFVYPNSQLTGVKVKTSPYPGFATDLQQPLTPLMLLADRQSLIIDTIYPKRTRHIPELIKMGAKIRVIDGQIVIDPTEQLMGTQVTAEEIRGGASLMIAALMAQGTTVINQAENIMRGYDCIIDKLHDLQAEVSYSGTELF
ncbi:MAG: UDP-N-acetylglucosamine 1-carboxyvinyltransferase [Lactobacillus sp.]|uniref:UDP-N-acetylglucosamine 1-carboxyvinyltransferase n=1 Tax=Bombilactobacillus bombi TaxID=1303590 RepID=A0A347SPT9_9LACO|nr:UDP-N-acetylglucosamine 1-carboxyvinyltransferase [Bombilactobacillus bombi]AXX64048.1 UDP-N-acetylglucosamine 1-carboxyvinyltransferase [Bombilactobacillus bombi]MCO6542624.1 UDP-N-acetylglucosamine 1-carboxyvinyltransferase [Lactobacillus sp.]RHW51947.1 UDP-N-acetylglucosamine 1-carboxyvinyltransferase [Bombilactobacillus bombi]